MRVKHNGGTYTESKFILFILQIIGYLYLFITSFRLHISKMFQVE